MNNDDDNDGFYNDDDYCFCLVWQHSKYVETTH